MVKSSMGWGVFALPILLFLICGCATTYYPTGDYGNRVKAYYDPLMENKCSVCGEPAMTYKVTDKGKVICCECYRKIKGH